MFSPQKSNPRKYDVALRFRRHARFLASRAIVYVASRFWRHAFFAVAVLNVNRGILASRYITSRAVFDVASRFWRHARVWLDALLFDVACSFADGSQFKWQRNSFTQSESIRTKILSFLFGTSKKHFERKLSYFENSRMFGVIYSSSVATTIYLGI
jgi:hypothetical protein